MEEPQIKAINPANAPQPIGAYSQAMRVKAGELIFIAGQVALDAAGNLVGKGDVAAQTRQVFENIGRVLAGAGVSFSNVVEFTTFLLAGNLSSPLLTPALSFSRSSSPTGIIRPTLY
jgi:enamine deaminase RidA (YjgF/YER057c/UK114 family)